ncbi:MAG: T9SS type A sorting domain-containing protein [Bacteroidales bacterium]|nr:T9SS type A sorting domain-containing protein [Bacteroidales bacterium]
MKLIIKKRKDSIIVGVMIVILSLSTSVCAQYESFFGSESWEYAVGFQPIMGTSDYDPELLGCLTNQYHFTTSDTVTINGKVYFYSTTYSWSGYPVKIREDTLLGRLYSLVEGREFMICDMSLTVGDTFRLPCLRYYDYVPTDTMLFLVDSVAFVNSKKIIHLSAISQEASYWWHFFLFGEAFNITFRFMEGIGPMYGIMPPHQLGDVLLCLNKNDNLYYMTHPDLGCWQTVSAVSDYPEEAMMIYPNPANNQISISFKTGGKTLGDLVIRDITGRVCFQTKVSEPVVKLNIADLNTGIYLITFKDSENRKITKKIIKK